MPSWKSPPSRRRDSKKPVSVLTSAARTGRRYARRASLERIFSAHGFSSAALAGSQTKIARRDGVSFGGPEFLYGPPICTAPTLA